MVERAPDDIWYIDQDVISRIAPVVYNKPKRFDTIRDGTNCLAQTQSSLLAKLPLEIRQLIYLHYLGNMTIDLVSGKHKSYIRELPESCCRDELALTPRIDSRRESHVYPLLQSCRQMYVCSHSCEN